MVEVVVSEGGGGDVWRWTARKQDDNQDAGGRGRRGFC